MGSKFITVSGKKCVAFYYRRTLLSANFIIGEIIISIFYYRLFIIGQQIIIGSRNFIIGGIIIGENYYRPIYYRDCFIIGNFIFGTNLLSTTLFAPNAGFDAILLSWLEGSIPLVEVIRFAGLWLKESALVKFLIVESR